MVDVGQCQRKRRANSGSDQFDPYGHVNEEDFWPKNLVVTVISIKFRDFPDLQDIILDGNLILVHIVTAIEVQ